MRVAFRVDASRKIGTGHVMRCLALAHGLRKSGADITFICADLEGNFTGCLQKAGFTVYRLPRTLGDYEAVRCGDRSPYEEWLGAPWEVDAEQTGNLLKGKGLHPDYLVVDHYALDCRWEKKIAPFVDKFLVIDDLADRRHDCDILVDQNLPDDGGARYNHLVRQDTIVLAGPRYALLRPEFAAAREYCAVRNAGLRRLLIMFGGSDETGETLKALHGAVRAASDIGIDVVVSSHNYQAQEIEHTASRLEQVCLAMDPPEVSHIMARADFSLGAGGVTLWERCAVRLPSASTVVAENQRMQIRTAEEVGLILLTGDARSTDEESYREVVKVMCRNSALVKRMSEVCGRTTDGRGVERVVRQLTATPVTIRAATGTDCLRVLEWRNSPIIRRYSSDPQRISAQQHHEWFMNAIADPARVLLIGEMADEEIGIVRFDLDDCKATVSIYLKPDFVGSGIGGRLLATAESHLRMLAPRVRKVHAHILPANAASRLMCERAGYKQTAMEMIKHF